MSGMKSVHQVLLKDNMLQVSHQLEQQLSIILIDIMMSTLDKFEYLLPVFTIHCIVKIPSVHFITHYRAVMF